MKNRGIGALLLAVPLSAAALAAGQSETAAAGPVPAPTYFEGADGMGAILVGDQGSVEVEKEHLSFSLSEFPADPLETTAENFLAYGGKFTAEYTFRNLADEPKDLTLVLPLGTLPEYYPCGELDRTALGYSVKQDGKDVALRLRHTALSQKGSGEFDLEEGLRRLYGRTDDFYRDDLPVTAYTFRVDVSPSEPATTGAYEYDFVHFSILFDASVQHTRILCRDRCGYGVKDGRAKLSYGFNCVEESPARFTVYVLGEDISAPETHVFRYERNAVVTDESAVVTVESRNTSTFSDLALSFRGENGAVTEEDWKNAFIDGIEAKKYARTCFSDFIPQDLDEAGALMQWYEYTVTVPAQGRAVNAVTAPIYPTVDETPAQDLYSYRYLLSPAQKWENFGQLTVDIDTPFYISDSSLTFSEREGGGYTLTRESLPLGELTFTLSEEERSLSGDKNLTNYDDGGDSALITAIVIMCIVVAGAATVTVLLIVQSRRKKKRREEEERRMLQTRPQEGKIDLPEEDGGPDKSE